MLVGAILPAARLRLVSVYKGSTLLQAARFLGSGTDLLVVCDAAGRLAGVVTKTDVVKQIGQCQGDACKVALTSAMTADVLSCKIDDSLETAWAQMNAQALKNIPVVTAAYEPIGILNARDALLALLSESSNEAAMMRDYVMGVGYR